MPTNSQRPELPTNLPPGTLVWVRRSPNDMRHRSESDRYIEARIVKAARVWVEIEAAGEGSLIGQAWRMRRDTQNEGTQFSGNNMSFLTEAQYRWQRRHSAAFAYLREQGIHVERGPWEGREVELAEALRRGAAL